MSNSPVMRAGLRVVVFGWFIAAVAVGRQELLQRLPPPAIPALILSLTALLFMAYRRLTPLQQLINSIDLRGIVALHLTRFVGLYFLYLQHRGFMPAAFAIPAGIGDIVTAGLAGLIIALPLSTTQRRHAITIWNVIGFADIMLVLFSAARLTLADPAGMQALTYLPLSLLPTFLVPLIIASHLVIFVRLNRTEDAS